MLENPNRIQGDKEKVVMNLLYKIKKYTEKDIFEMISSHWKKLSYLEIKKTKYYTNY